MGASKSVAALAASIRALRPAAVIYGVGDAAHQQAASDHNPDDTPGVVSEQTDGDSVPEYRAIDVMIGNGFTSDDAHALVRDITTIEANRRRARYVIYLRTIYRRATGYQPEPYTGTNPHINHVHVSSHVSDDANGSPWTLTNLGADMNEAELNNYVAKYAPRSGNTSPTQRAVRDDWQTLNGTRGLIAKVDALALRLDQLAADMAELVAKVDAIPGAQLGDHTHAVSATTTGPVVEE